MPRSRFSILVAGNIVQNQSGQLPKTIMAFF